MRLENKTALITGASRNIGKEIALTFAREGADLILNTLTNNHELEAVAAQCRELGVKTHTVLGDVSDSPRVSAMVSEGIEALGKIDILVSNVAIRPHRPILEVTDDEWHQVLGVNLDSAFYLCKAVLPGMMERRSGSIVALGGQAAITGRPGTATVTTAKTGLLGLIRAIAAEMAEYNVRANMVNPGSTDTERRSPEWYPEHPGESRGADDHLKEIPMHRQGTVEDIANAVLFFASDESAYITGDRLNVVGGKYIV
ncbi:MAG: SDR family oxidoreductase [Chloroflexota bacterium]|nr:SDR family oxidoreductase [Chloroflexota bacterium]